jgi:hypothetical protein
MKKFQDHFYMLLDKFKAKENFAYSRFSDGELRIMQNKELVLAQDHYKIGDQKVKAAYHPEDHKHFDPAKHQHIRKKLMDSYEHLQHNYYVGLSCRCCVGDADFHQMLRWYKGDPNSDNLTWANLWVNGNFPLFRTYMVPEFSNRKIVYIVNEKANIAGLPFHVERDFRIGENCIVNNYGMEKEIGQWIEENNVKNYVFLFSASSLSNMLIYELFKKYPDNTYIDIGTTLNDYLGMKGLRGYLTGSNRKVCIW